MTRDAKPTPRGKKSKHFGEFKNGAWVPYLIGWRKHDDKLLVKCTTYTNYCPSCGKDAGYDQETSKMRKCPHCNRVFVISAFTEVERGSRLYNMAVDAGEMGL